MSISAAFSEVAGAFVLGSVRGFASVKEAAKAKSCLSRSAMSFDKLPWNSGFAVLHG